MTKKDCGANCTNRCSIGECPHVVAKGRWSSVSLSLQNIPKTDEFDGFILDIDEEAIAKANAEKEQAATTEACKLNDDGTCDGCTI